MQCARQRGERVPLRVCAGRNERIRRVRAAARANDNRNSLPTVVLTAMDKNIQDFAAEHPEARQRARGRGREHDCTGRNQHLRSSVAQQRDRIATTRHSSEGLTGQ